MAAAALPAQQPAPKPAAKPAPKSTPCDLIPQTALRRLTLPRDVKGVPDSTGVGCRWGRVEDSQALVLKTYAVMTSATIERMRIAASKTSDPILEPTVGPAAWSVGESFGRIVVAGKDGRAFQLQYFLKPHSKGADRVDVRATNADRLALLEVAKAALARL
jgi:hypothetical protein